MKNIMVYIHPDRKVHTRFKEGNWLINMALDNAIQMGWKREDIYLYMNFPYKYSYTGVQSIILPDKVYCPFRPLSTKTLAISYLFENDLFPDDICWVHDFDAWQQGELDVDLEDAIAGISDYGWSKLWQMGSYFVTPKAKDLFIKVKKTIYKHEIEDERAMKELTEVKKEKGIKKINITYNFGMRKLAITYPMAKKPLRVLHFHPHYNDKRLPASTLNMFMYGKSPVGKPLMTKQLIKLFHLYGFK